jgi:hypothetical protein
MIAVPEIPSALRMGLNGRLGRELAGAAPASPRGGVVVPFTPGQQSRQDIDQALNSAGWIVQEANAVSLSTGLAVCELPSACGSVDYARLVDGGMAQGA